MSDFNQPLSQEEFDFFSEASSKVNDVQEELMFAENVLFHGERICGSNTERGEMLQELHQEWQKAIEQFNKSTDIIFNSLAKEHDEHLKFIKKREALKKAAMLGLTIKKHR